MSTPRSLASLRTGGLASARTSDGADEVRAETDGTAGSSAPSTIGDGPGWNEPCACTLAAAAPTATPGDGGLAGAAYGHPVGLVAADQALALAATAGARVGQVDLHLGLGRGGSRRGGRGRGSLVGVADRDDRRADRDHLALGHHQLEHGAGVRRRQLDQRLGGLDLDHDVVDLDDVADLDLPGHDLGLGQAFTDVGQLELRHAGPSQKLSERSTASSSRSRSGRKSSSIRDGGYGVSKPPTRSTGDSRE